MQTPPPVGNLSYVPLYNAVVVAKGMLLLTDTDNYEIQMIDLAQKAVLGMNPLSLQVLENFEVDVVNGVATLPEGIVIPLAMRYCTHDGRAFGGYIADVYWLEKACCSVGEESSWDSGIVTLVGNEYRWINPASAPEKIKVAAITRKLDTDGSFTFMIRDYMEMAVASYICWQMSLRLQRVKAYTTYQIEEWKKMWMGERGSVVSGDAQRHFYNHRKSFDLMQKPQRIEIF